MREVAGPERDVMPCLCECFGHQPVALRTESFCRQVVERVFNPYSHAAYYTILSVATLAVFVLLYISSHKEHKAYPALTDPSHLGPNRPYTIPRFNAQRPVLQWFRVACPRLLMWIVSKVGNAGY